MVFKSIIVFNLFWNYLWIPKGNVLTHECISHDYLVSSVNNNGSFSIQEIRYNCSLFDQQTIAFVTNPSLKNKDMYLLCNYVCTVYTMQRGTLIFFGWNWEENSKYDLTFGQLGMKWKMQDIGHFLTSLKLLNTFFHEKRICTNVSKIKCNDCLFIIVLFVERIELDINFRVIRNSFFGKKTGIHVIVQNYLM